MDTIRLGLIGAGAIAHFTAAEFARHPAARLVAVADPSIERAGELARTFSIATACASAAELLDQDLDAVYIAVPNVLHAPLAIAALESGRHVLLEKPFAIDLAAAERVAEAARDAGCTLMIGMNQRFDPAVQRARLLLADGALGEVYHAKAWWRRRSGIPRIGSWFTHREAAGGGALLDIGVHMLDACLHLIGAPRVVGVSGATATRFGNRGLGDGAWGRSEREHPDFDVEDFATALIRLEGGATIALDAAWAMHQDGADRRGIELFGTEGTLSVFDQRLYKDAADGAYATIERPATAALPFPHMSRAAHFVNVLLGSETPLVTVDEALAVQAVLDAIYSSAATGREVVL
jgi:predicted dehydrogenase